MNEPDIFLILLLLSIFVWIYVTCKDSVKYKNICTIFLIIVFLILMFLELKYTYNVEKSGDNKFVRLNTDNFSHNPHKEIKRYITDVCYFNNVWRISMAASCLIVLLFLPIIEGITIMWLFLITFCIIYHIWQWKIHHSYDFIFRTVIDCCDHIIEKKKYIQEIHP
jgi:hypothetical protein